MNAEVTEKIGRRGRIFYDAECSFCRAGVKRIGPIFARQGFVWRPLQTLGAADRLGMSERAMLEEMKLQLDDGRIVGGVEAWIHLFRSVWWLWPLGAVLSAPGLHGLGQGCYRWVARRRHCFGGKCAVSKPKRRRRVIPFLDLP